MEGPKRLNGYLSRIQNYLFEFLMQLRLLSTTLTENFSCQDCHLVQNNSYISKNSRNYRDLHPYNIIFSTTYFLNMLNLGGSCDARCLKIHGKWINIWRVQYFFVLVPYNVWPFMNQIHIHVARKSPWKLPLKG